MRAEEEERRQAAVMCRLRFGLTDQSHEQRDLVSMEVSVIDINSTLPSVGEEWGFSE